MYILATMVLMALSFMMGCIIGASGNELEDEIIALNRKCARLEEDLKELQWVPVSAGKPAPYILVWVVRENIVDEIIEVDKDAVDEDGEWMHKGIGPVIKWKYMPELE